MEQDPNMETETFMFIPDLTGYTRYMATTDSTESHRIVEQLLKCIADSENLDLTISDIVGDAIFFFREGKPPVFKDLLKQCFDMINSLQLNLRNILEAEGYYDEAALKAQALGIKFVSHFGMTRISDIRGHSQLIGKASIEVNKLLKNSVPLDNYLLISKDCLEASPGSSEEQYSSLEGADLYRHVGILQYRAYDLDKLASKFN